MFAWDFEERVERDIDRWDAAQDAAMESGDEPCPECGGILCIAGRDSYGADRDGMRGVSVPVWYCENCGYAESGLP